MFGLFVALVCAGAAVRPVVLLHGMLATNQSMDEAAGWVRAAFPGVYVANLDTGSRLGALVADMNTLCAQVAALIKADPQLQSGFNGIGHSQGGLLLRCYVERYMHLGYPRMHNLVSWLGVQNGVFGVPAVNALCPDRWPWCLALDALLDTFLDDPGTSYGVQDHLTFADFWKDIMHYDDYLRLNSFLADVNNERPAKKAQYRSNMLLLEGFLCVYGLQVSQWVGEGAAADCGGWTGHGGDSADLAHL